MASPDKTAQKILAAALFLVALAFFSAFALRPVQLRMLAAIEEARDALLEQAEAALGKKIAYRSAGLAFPVLIDIRGVSIAGGDSGIPDFSIARLRIRYSFKELLFALKEKAGVGKLSASVKEVVIDKPSVMIDTRVFSGGGASEERERDGLLAAEEELRKVFAFLPDGLVVRVNKGAVGIAAEEVAANLKAFKAELRVKKGRVKLGASWKADGSFSNAQVKKINNREPLAVGVEGRLRADFSVSGDSGRGTLRLSNIRSSLLDVPQLAFSLTFAEQRLSLEKTGGRLPYALSMNVDLETGEVAADFSAERFAVYSFATPKGAFRHFAPWFPAALSGTARVTATLDADMKPTAPRFDVALNGAFRRQSPIGASVFVIQGAGNSRQAWVSRLGVTMPQDGPLFKGELSFDGAVVYRDLAVDGVFRIKDFMIREGRPITGEFIIDTYGRTTTFFAETFLLGDVEFSAFNIDVTREEESAIIGVSALRFREIPNEGGDEAGFGDIRIGRLSSEGFFNWQENRLDFNLTLDEMPAEDLFDIADVFASMPKLPDMLNNIVEGTAFTAVVYGSTDFKSVTYNVPVFVTAYTGKEKNGKSTSVTARFSIFGTETRFSIDDSTVNMPDGMLNVSADFDFADFDDILFNAELTYKDLFYFFNGQVLDRTSVTLSGSYDLQAFFSLGGAGSFSGYIRASEARIPYHDHIINVNLAASLHYESAVNWSFDLDTFEIQNILIGTTRIVSFRILQGSINQSGIDLPIISLTDTGGTLAGSGYADWNTSFDNIDFTVNLSDTRGSEIFFANGNYSHGALELHTNTSAFKLSRFIKNSFNAAVSGSIDVEIGNIFSKTFEGWSLAVNISSLSAEIGSSVVNIATHGELRPERISLFDTRVNWGGMIATVPSIDFADGQLSADAEIHGTVMGRMVDIALNTAVHFQNFSNVLDPNTYSHLDGDFSLSAMNIDDWTMESPCSFTFSRRDATLSLNGGPSNMVRLEMNDSGEFYAGFSTPSPIRGTVTGHISEGNITARGSNLYVDLLSLWNYVPAQDVLNIKGGFAIADIEVRGPLNDPEFYGTAQGASVRMDIPHYLNDQIGPVPIAVRLDGQQMRFGPVRAPCGTGYGVVSGVFEFSRWIPGNFTITIDVDDDNLIPYKVNIAGVNAYGETSGHLEIALQDATLSITGDLLCENTELTIDPAGFNQSSSSASSQNSSPSHTVIDFTITTGRRVDFLWPNADLPILQANPASGNSINISSDNFSGSFEMKGDIDIRSGEIFYIERSFYIREGTLSFNENETRFEPTIAARAEIRDRTESGPVTISLVIDNQPLSSFQARFESSPALSQAEIFSLLGQNIVGGETTDTGRISGSFSGAITDILSQFSVVRRIERAIRDTLHIDMFSVRTQAISNLFLQATGTQLGQDADRSFSRYFDNTTVFFGKYLTSDFFVQGMLSLRYDDQLTDLTQQELKFEPDLGIELRSPLFDIRWNIIPTHPENLFIPDTSFTILWRRTF
jgi:hypothetical protein